MIWIILALVISVAGILFAWCNDYSKEIHDLSRRIDGLHERIDSLRDFIMQRIENDFQMLKKSLDNVNENMV
jgi:hypothetical protein